MSLNLDVHLAMSLAKLPTELDDRAFAYHAGTLPALDTLFREGGVPNLRCLILRMLPLYQKEDIDGFMTALRDNCPLLAHSRRQIGIITRGPLEAIVSALFQGSTSS